MSLSLEHRAQILCGSSGRLGSKDFGSGLMSSWIGRLSKAAGKKPVCICAAAQLAFLASLESFPFESPGEDEWWSLVSVFVAKY